MAVLHKLDLLRADGLPVLCSAITSACRPITWYKVLLIGGSGDGVCGWVSLSGVDSVVRRHRCLLEVRACYGADCFVIGVQTLPFAWGLC